MLKRLTRRSLALVLSLVLNLALIASAVEKTKPNPERVSFVLPLGEIIFGFTLSKNGSK